MPSFSRRSNNNNKKQPSSFKSASRQIPAPFSQAPASLQPLLERLDPARVYITHIDRHPVDYKRQIFLIPVLLNLTIAALLAWRVLVAAPVYLALLQTLLGYTSSATVDVEKTTRNEQVWTIVRRTGMFGVDFVLFRFVGVWPLFFFLEQPANPVTWRWRLGFRAHEAVVRVSRNWGAEDLMKGVKQGEENAFFKTRVLPAIGRERMQKTGYLMMDASWDLEFELMQDAHTLVELEKMRMEELEKRVFVYLETVGWLTWRWEREEDVAEGRRKQVVTFKDKLTAMGKESLFWRWTEIVEGGRDVDGGFSSEKQKRVAEQVQEAFEADGVDFDATINSIGGLEAPAK